eukprot:g7182.t1
MEASGDLAMQEVKDISRMMLYAIAAVHHHGLMHRDIKPENFRFKDQAATTLQAKNTLQTRPNSGFW